MIEAFEWTECDFKGGPTGGCLGGRKKLACPKDGTGRSYVVKYEKYGQSLNELVAQCLLKEIGLKSLPTAWISLFNSSSVDSDCRWYGALEYVPSLENLSLEALMQANSNVIEDYFKHLVMGDCILKNLGETEIYKDLNGAVYSLDYGEIDVSEAFLEIMRSYGQLSGKQAASFDDVVLKSLNNITANSILTQYSQKVKNLLDSVKALDPDRLKNAAKSVFGAFAEIPKDKTDDIMDSIEEHTNGITAAYYEGWTVRKRSACRRALKLLG